MMKMTESSLAECSRFFEQHPPFMLSSREQNTYDAFAKYADHAYNGICFAFFAPDYYSPVNMGSKFIALNFDKICEPEIFEKTKDFKGEGEFELNGKAYNVKHTGLLTRVAHKTDRFSDALIYVASMLPQKKKVDYLGEYRVIRTDHRFHPHFRRKIYSQRNSFCADLPYGYLNIYANSSMTLSDRAHACAVTLAYGGSAMLFSKTDRVGLLDRVGAGEISKHPVKLDLDRLNHEKQNMKAWIRNVLVSTNI